PAQDGEVPVEVVVPGGVGEPGGQVAGVVAGAGARGQVDLGVGLQGPGQGQCEAVQQVGLEVLGDAVGESGGPGRLPGPAQRRPDPAAEFEQEGLAGRGRSAVV